MLNDLKHSLRIIAKFPISNSVIVFTIASLVTVISLLYHSVTESFGKEMPFEDSDRLVRFWKTTEDSRSSRLPAEIFSQLRTNATSFEQVGGFVNYQRHTLTGSGDPVTLNAVIATSEVLEISGFKPLRGRYFSRTDEQPGNTGIVVLGERIWRKYLNADPDILGQEIQLNEKPYIVVGIAPDAIYNTHLVRAADVWMPYDWSNAEQPKKSINVVARLNPDTSRQSAQAEIDVATAQFAERFPLYDIRKLRLTALDTELNGNWSLGALDAEIIMLILFAFTLMASIVLIACFNMTCLFLVQATSRAREFAVRLSVGASRGRIIRQMLMESTVLSFAGGLAGIGLTFGIQKLGAFQNIKLGVSNELLILTIGSAIVIGALVSVLPALRAGRTNLNDALKDGGQSSASRHRHRLRNFLIGSQVAMATILTVSSVFYSRAFVHFLAETPPIDIDRIVSVDVSLERRQYDDDRKVSNYAQQALDAIEQMPGVERANVASVGFLSSWFFRQGVEFSDTTLNQRPDNHALVINSSPDYLDMNGQAFVRGRAFSAGAMALNEVVVNEEFVRQMLPDDVEAIGQEMTFKGMDGIRVTITGVVSNRHQKLVAGDRVVSEAYISHEHPFDKQWVTATVQTKADAAQFGIALRETLQRLNSRQPVGKIRVLRDQIDERTRHKKSSAGILLGMAAFGVFMSLMGVYGVVAYAAVERTREMGIRMAFGATRARIVRLIMNEGTRLLAFGIIPGTAFIFLLFQGLPNDVLSEFDPSDPWTFIIGAIVIFLAGTTAALLPARKMINLKPSEALRYE